MARVFILFAVIIKFVIAEEGFKNCNECIRNGGQWCNEIGSQHCHLSPKDDWCLDAKESLPKISMESMPGDLVNPVYVENQLYIGKEHRQNISFSSVNKPEVKINIVNSTQKHELLKSDTFEIKEVATKCMESKCTTTISARPAANFCTKNGGINEHIYVNVTLGNSDEMTVIKYEVSCACPCSLKPDVKSVYCNGNGDLVCGACSCYAGWTGDFCDKKFCSTKGGCPASIKDKCRIEKNSQTCNFNGDFDCGECRCHQGWSGKFCADVHCEVKRGDVQCNNPAMLDLECSGNGYCGPCETCICYRDREGSQYFNAENYCSDLCMTISDCDTCLRNSTLGVCTDCNHLVTKAAYNESLINIRDQSNRKIWVGCNETIDDCSVKYYAMRDGNEQINIMIVEHCDFVVTQELKSTKVPIIMGVLGILAAVVAVAGVMAWKHFNTVPPLPLSDPEYQNIDAEDCTGENPLYKSPMSSFKNPTYGKW